MPTNAELLSLALGHHQGGNLTEAESAYRRILATDARDVNALHLLGLVRHRLGDHAAASALIRQAIALQPRVAVMHANLGIALAAQKLTQEAAACFQEALR